MAQEFAFLLGRDDLEGEDGDDDEAQDNQQDGQDQAADVWATASVVVEEQHAHAHRKQNPRSSFMFYSLCLDQTPFLFFEIPKVTIVSPLARKHSLTRTLLAYITYYISGYIMCYIYFIYT